MSNKVAKTDPSKLEPRVVCVPPFRPYWVRVGMLGEFTGLKSVYAAEVWIGRTQDNMKPRAFTIAGLPPTDAHKIKLGSDLFERVNLILDPSKRVKGLVWKK